MNSTSRWSKTIGHLWRGVGVAGRRVSPPGSRLVWVMPGRPLRASAKTGGELVEPSGSAQCPYGDGRQHGANTTEDHRHRGGRGVHDETAEQRADRDGRLEGRG